MKGMETDPTVILLIVKYKCFGYWSDPEVTLAVAVLEKTLLCPWQCYLFRYLDCTSNTV